MSELVKALRYCGNFTEREGCDESCEYFNDMDCPKRIMFDAADAIEELQAQLEDRTNQDEQDKILEYLRNAPVGPIGPIEPMRIELLPKHGEWKPFDLTYGRSIYYCSVCEQATEVPMCMEKPMYAYCPNCGAKMTEVQDGQ